MILITGAGGKTGRVLIKALSKQESLCAFVHREEQALLVQSLGASKVIVGDMGDEVAIRSAMQGARAIYHLSPNMSPDEVKIGRLVIDEARKAGVEHFVYHSVLHPQIKAMLHHWDKLHVEEMIFESGIPFTILQPAPYMQNLLVNWETITEKGVLRVPYSIDAKFSFVDLKDVTEVAAVVLKGTDHFNAIYELAGTLPTSHTEMAEMFSYVFKREVRAEKEEIKDWKARATGLSTYATENLIRMFEYYDQHGLAGNPNIMRWVLKREPTTLEAFARNNIKPWN